MTVIFLFCIFWNQTNSKFVTLTILLVFTLLNAKYTDGKTQNRYSRTILSADGMSKICLWLVH